MDDNEGQKPDRLHTFSRETLEAHYRALQSGLQLERDEHEKTSGLLKNYRDAQEAAAAKLAAYEAASEPFEPADVWGKAMTAGQLWHALLTDPVERRLMRLRGMLSSAEAASRCFEQDHQSQIDALTHDLTDTQVRLERALRLGGPRPLTALVTAVEALRQVMVDGIAARTQVTELDEVELPEWRGPDLSETRARIGEQLKSAGIDTQALCHYEWPALPGEPGPCDDHVCGVVNPLHTGNHVCEQGCGTELTQVGAEKIEEAKQKEQEQ